MDRLWAPWRKKFLRHGKPKGCIFCEKPKSRRDAANYVVERGKAVFSMLNLYPYNNGHVLISPYRHLKNVTDFTPAESKELFEMIQRTVKKLDKILKPDGYNIGANIGRAAGAGFDKHVHFHVVPRWVGDTNFMPVNGDTKIISESLDALRKSLLAV
jgi:ATP adenylyltransferase